MCSLVGLLSLYHEHILNEDAGGGAAAQDGNATAADADAAGARRARGIPWPLMIAIVQQVEVLGEVAAAARGRARAGARATAAAGLGAADVAAALGDGSSYRYLVISLIESLKAALRYCQLARGEGNILIDGNAFDADRNDCNGAVDGRAGPRVLPGLSGRWADDDDVGLGGSMTPTQRRRAAQRAMSQLRNRLRAESRALAPAGSAAAGGRDRGASDDELAAHAEDAGAAGSPSSVGSVGDDELAGGDCEDLAGAPGARGSSKDFVGPPWWFQRLSCARGDGDGGGDGDGEGDARGGEAKPAADGFRRCPSLHPSLQPGKMPPQVRRAARAPLAGPAASVCSPFASRRPREC